MLKEAALAAAREFPEKATAASDADVQLLFDGVSTTNWEMSTATGIQRCIHCCDPTREMHDLHLVGRTKTG
jgi:hypothetical protein